MLETTKHKNSDKKNSELKKHVLVFVILIFLLFLSMTYQISLINNVLSQESEMMVTASKIADVKCHGIMLNFVINNNVSYAVIDLTEKKIIDNQYTSSLNSMGEDLSNKFSFQMIQNSKRTPLYFDYNPITQKILRNPIPYCYQYNIKNNYRFRLVKKWSEVMKSDHLLIAADELGKTFSEYMQKEINVGGFSHADSRYIAMPGYLIYFGYITNGQRKEARHILMHEEGHRLGLDHTPNRYDDNLMSYAGPGHNALSEQQKDEIMLNYILKNNHFENMKKYFLSYNQSNNHKIIMKKNLIRNKSNDLKRQIVAITFKTSKNEKFYNSVDDMYSFLENYPQVSYSKIAL